MARGILKNRRDYTGQRFGNLTAIRPADHVDPSGRSRMWLFRCDCGALVERPAAIVALVAKKKRKDGTPFAPKCSRSCSLTMLPGNEAAFNQTYSAYRRDAERRGLVFELTKEQVKHLSQQPCAYCGALPGQLARHSTRPGRRDVFVRNGIDRVDSTQGYVLTNAVSCCKQCNRAKSDLSRDAFLAWVERVHAHNK